MTSETFTRSFGWFWDPAHSWHDLKDPDGPKDETGGRMTARMTSTKLQTSRCMGKTWKNSPSCDWVGVKALRVVLCWTFTTCLVHDLGTLSQGAINNRPATCLTFFFWHCSVVMGFTLFEVDLHFLPQAGCHSSSGSAHWVQATF
jgi:hypothetical protein